MCRTTVTSSAQRNGTALSYNIIGTATLNGVNKTGTSTLDVTDIYNEGRASVDSYDSVAMQLRADSEHSGLVTFQIELENDKVITGQKYVTWE